MVESLVYVPFIARDIPFRLELLFTRILDMYSVIPQLELFHVLDPLFDSLGTLPKNQIWIATHDLLFLRAVIVGKDGQHFYIFR